MKKAKETANLKNLLEQLRENNKNTQRSSNTEPTEIEEPKTVKNIKSDIQAQVDEYLDVWTKAKELEKKMRELRKSIKPYMDGRKINFIEGSENRGSIELANQDRVQITSRYTAYNVEDVQAHIPFELFSEVLVEVVDADKLKGVVALSDEIPNSLLEDLKVKMPTTIFKVNRP